MEIFDEGVLYYSNKEKDLSKIVATKTAFTNSSIYYEFTILPPLGCSTYYNKNRIFTSKVVVP